MIITKSDFLKYKECSSYFWFTKLNPQVLSEEKLDPFIERLKLQGTEVELFARGLFPDGVLVNGKLERAALNTAECINLGCKEIFQASFLVEGLFASCDVLVWNELFQGWDIIEIKSSTDKERKSKEHILDAAFQRLVVEKAGLKVVNVYLIELNKDYFRDGDIDIDALFNQTEITTECIEIEQQLIVELQDAKKLLNQPEPTECSCKYKGRSRHCLAFDHLYPNVPSYSIYDLRAIGSSKRVLKQLVDSGSLNINDIADDIELNTNHTKQQWVNSTKEIIIEKDVIKQQFDQLQYPLYFLDYETLACGIPKYDETYPYQQTVFQYSLHILNSDGSTVHKEFIHRDQSTPVHIVAQRLREDIGDVGHVIVWNKGFEGKCNADLANVNQDLSDFLLDLNKRIYDLMEIFRRMEYLHDDFKGSYSIKNVLPVMCPELSYDKLEVTNGAAAVVEYENLIFGNVPEDVKDVKINALLEYCKLDTWAMVRIYQELRKLVSA